MNYAFCGDKPEPILESIKRWRNSCGEEAWARDRGIKTLVDKAHTNGLPVIYTTGVRARRQLGLRLLELEERPLRRGSCAPTTNVDGNEIVAEIAPGPQDIVIYKQKPSGFFGTNVTSYLTLLGCDSVDRHRHHHVRLRARHRARCVQPELPRRAGGGRLLRPLASEPRHQPVRHERQICRRGDGAEVLEVLRQCLPWASSIYKQLTIDRIPRSG